MLKLPIHFAPLQGYTDATYRRLHARLFGGVACYYTPFLRVEHGEVRRKDLRELSAAPSEDGIPLLIPQIIASTPNEGRMLAEAVVARGYREIDVNLGCPFPLQARRHKGAGILPYPAEVEALLQSLFTHFPEVRFSVKMRLGWDSVEECITLAPMLNDLPLKHIVMHPRLGKQQYKGNVDLETFEAFSRLCRLPLVYNGDLVNVGQMHAMEIRFPQLSGLMLGRGLLQNPALAWEYCHDKVLSRHDKLLRIREFHTALCETYHSQLEGDTAQLLARMRTIWSYLLPEGDRKVRKTIQKTRHWENYIMAVNDLLQE